MVNKVTSKLQVLYHPPLPATCAVCGKSANGKTRFLDFQKDLDYYGAVVICEDCFKEGLEVLDYVPVAQVQRALEEITTLQAQLETAEAERDRYRGAIDSLRSVRTDLLSDSDSADNVDGTDTEATT